MMRVRIKRILAAVVGAISEPLNVVFALPWLMLGFVIAVPIFLARSVYQVGYEFREKGMSWKAVIPLCLSLAVLWTALGLGVALPLAIGFSFPVAFVGTFFYAIYSGAGLGYRQGFKSVFQNAFLVRLLMGLRIQFAKLLGNNEEARAREIELDRMMANVMRSQLRRRGVPQVEIEQQLAARQQNQPQNQPHLPAPVEPIVMFAPDNPLIANQLLASKINSLESLEKKITFLSEDEIKKVDFIENPNHPAKKALQQYQARLNEYTCPFTLDEMNVIRHPVTIEFHLHAENKEAFVFRRVFEKEKYMVFLHALSPNRYAFMPDSPDKILNGVALEGNDGGTCLIGKNVKPLVADAKNAPLENRVYEVRIYKGFSPEIVSELQTYMEIVRSLNATNQHAFYHHASDASRGVNPLSQATTELSFR